MANTSVHIIGCDSGGTRSWYVVNNTDMEIPIVPIATTLATPDLRGSTYIPVGGVLLLRQYAVTGFMSIVSHPADAAPNETEPTKEGEVQETREENTAPALEMPLGGFPTGRTSFEESNVYAGPFR